MAARMVFASLTSAYRYSTAETFFDSAMRLASAPLDLAERNKPQARPTESRFFIGVFTNSGVRRSVDARTNSTSPPPYGPLDCESVAAAKWVEPCELADRDRPSAAMSASLPIVHPKKDSTLNTVAVCASAGPG